MGMNTGEGMLPLALGFRRTRDVSVVDLPK